MLTILASALFYAQAIPAPLAQVLQKYPALKVLSAPVNPADLDSMKESHYWPPWSRVDLDGDGRADIVAVVVGPDHTFAVIAIHAREPRALRWVVPLGKESITGVWADQPLGMVMPLYCYGCDSNPFYRWSGTGYEPSLFRIGEVVALSGYESGHFEESTRLHVESNLQSKAIAAAKAYSCVKVLARRGTSFSNRWYQVETLERPHVRGWVPASAVELKPCTGYDDGKD